MRHQTLLQKLSAAVLGLGLLAGTTAASAATISLQPNPAGGTVNTTFDIFVEGSNFVDGTTGGGLIVGWEPSAITLSGSADSGTYLVDPLDPRHTIPGLNITFAGDLFFTTADIFSDGVPVVYNKEVGTLSFSTSSLGVSGPTAGVAFAIATLTFDALAEGVTQTSISVNAPDFWFDGLVQVNPTMVPTTVIIDPTAVPEPMSLALVGSAVLGLVSLRRKGIAA